MPGVFRRAWDKVTKGSERKQQLREDKKRHALKKGERKRIVHTLAGGYKPREKHKTTRTGRPEDHFYLARAEAKRARRRRRRIREAINGGWGWDAQQLALEKCEWQ